MLLVNLKVDGVNALLNIVPGEELLSLSKRFCSKVYECVSVSVGKHTTQQFQYVFTMTVV